MGLVNVLPERFFINTLQVETVEEFFNLGQVVPYGWLDTQEAKPWPAVKLRQRTACLMYDGKVKIYYMGDYLVLCSSNPITIGQIAYFAHETRFYVEPVTLTQENVDETIWPIYQKCLAAQSALSGS